ncbi:hypothetical protein [Caldimonas brevitalea]|uniref:Flagellar protein FliT n=1 Tax=Caldimonas brevitalea TaxID=413882 RepID=A0A0G3BQV1_9BURK|nr:hypothetical protein [Caldimonas brevitalea]AKJ30363.1 hypothetical protein AAW51_3672 [Caldimonas brevitalea]
MADARQLLALAERLSAAASACDWAALAQVDRELAEALGRLAPPTEQSRSVRDAMAVLQHAHSRAQAACAGEAAALEARLADLGSRKEGWLAYAMADAGEGSPA